MKPDNLEVRAPDRASDHDELIDLVATTFAREDPDAMRRRCLDWYLDHSHYDWDASRIGLIGGRIVTHYGIWGYSMRIGTARVRAGGVGAVATAKEHRKKGLMALTAPASIEAMRELGYDMSVLFGIRGFYEKFGYVRAWHFEVWAVSAENLPDPHPRPRLLRFKPGRRADVEEIYAREHATVTGSAVRPTFAVWQPDFEGHRWADGTARTAGYVIVSRKGDALHCVESGGDPDQTLEALGTLARRLGAKEVKFDYPPWGSALCERLRRSECRFERYYGASGGPMVLTVKLASTLGKMSGELSRRLRRSDMSGWQGQLLIADARERVTLHVDGGRAKVGPPARTRHSVRGGHEIAQLLIGKDPPLEVVKSAGMRLGGDARALVQALFPEQHPTLRRHDLP